MKLIGICLAVLLAACGPSALLSAAEPRLPALRNGAWVRYHQTTKPGGTPVSTAIMTYRCCDQMQEDNQACRWFETEWVADDKSRHERRKFLIPEAAVASSATPTDAILRYLSQDDDERLVSLPADNSGWMVVNVLHFPGFLKSAVLSDTPRTVNFQRGTLSIPQAHEGTYKWWRKDRAPEIATVFESKYQVWMHPDLPLGFAHAKIRLGIHNGGRETNHYELEWTLQDFGTDAKPVIADITAPPR